MFTGLILELGEVFVLQNQDTLVSRILIKASATIIADCQVGDSICVNGVCLTVTSIQKNIITFDVSPETLQSTNLGQLRRGDKVNLEPSLKPTSKLGGHFVTGHIEDIGTIISKKQQGNSEKIEIKAPKGILNLLVPKGSIAIDGISLTVVDVLDSSFTVVIIPHTLELTTIGIKKIRDSVNLEPDILGKYVYKFLSIKNTNNNSKDNDEKFLSLLQKSGFM